MMVGTKIGQRMPATVNVAAAIHGAANATARAACALELLCGARGAGGGHLYLLRERGLARVASLPEASVDDDALLASAVTHLALELEPEMATAIATETSTQHTQTASWTDPHGAVYQPVSITCAVDGQELCAGVAMLRLDSSRDPQAAVAEIVASVGALLIEAGDAHAVPLEDVPHHLANRNAEHER